MTASVSGHDGRATRDLLSAIITSPAASIVVVAPHPDDETIAAAGLIQIAASAGARVTVVLLTDGDNNPWPQRVLERRIGIGARERERWGRRRRDEARAALALLGVPEKSTVHLGIPDLGLTDCLITGRDATVAELFSIFRDVAPTLVVAPALSDRHPDHSAAHVLCSIALEACDSGAQLISYVVHGDADASSIQLALDQAMRDRKRGAIAAYRTQLALSGRRILSYAEREERFALERYGSSSPMPAASSLPWRIGKIAASLASLMLAAADRTAVLPIESSTGAARGPHATHCVREADGRLTLTVPDGARMRAPVFVKLVSRVPSPWIYDVWGWARIDGG